LAVGQNTTTLSAALGTFYDRKLIEFEKPYLRMMQLAQMRPMPQNNGKTIYFTGYRPLPRPTSAMTEGSNPTAVSFGARQLSATIAEWGATAKMSKFLSMTKIDPGLMEQIAILGDNRGRTLDYELTKTVASSGIWAISAANRTTNVQTVTVSAVSGTNSTSTFVTTAATSLNAYSAAATWTGAVVTLVSDAADGTSDLGTTTVKYGWAGRVSSVTFSATAGDTIALKTAAPFAAAPEQFQSNDRVRIVALSNITTSTNISSTFFALAQRDLIANKAQAFGDGMYAAVIPSEILYSLKTDATWVAAASYSNVTELYKGEVGRWYGFRVLEATQPFRETVAGVEAETSGVVYHSFFVGRNAFEHSELSGGDNGIIVAQGPDSNEPIPRNVYVSWAQNFANKALTAPHCVSVVSGAAV
jgi:hypothetical protein